MSSSLSKRQQARNERVLQDLIKSVPGNMECADCQARNPGWASWSLGIFLCMRCAAIHRKLGTHISKVKSLSMDSWTNEQVENMKRTGNIASNKNYNPQNAKPPVPFDADEADSAIERFIRQKYQERTMHERGRAPAAARHHSGSTESDDNPPALPPKNGIRRFGFRSTSSIFPMTSKSKREAAARAHLEASRERRRSPSPGQVKNKPSRVFGASVSSDGSGSDDLDGKLAKLREMGFMDEKRNVTILRGLSGNLEKTIETLARLGEGSGPRPTSRSRTPSSATAGIITQRNREYVSPTRSNNPWDIPAAQPQSSQSTGTLVQAKQEQQQVNGNPYHNSNGNPFEPAPSQSQNSLNQQHNLDQPFQNMSLGQSQQPLFPNHTGGFPNRQPFQAAAAPSMPTIPQNRPTTVFDSPVQQSPQTAQSYNPFLQASLVRSFSPVSNGTFSSNPYAQSQSPNLAQPAYYDQSSQQQQAYYDPNHQPQNFQQQQQQKMQLSPQRQTNPFLYQSQQGQQSQPQQQYIQFQSQSQQTQPQQQLLLPQQTGRADKQSILALYNYPQSAFAVPQQLPPIDTNPTQNQNQNAAPGYVANQTQAFLSMPTSAPQQQQSVSTPLSAYVSGSRNPFMNGDSGRFAQGGNGVSLQPMSAPPEQPRHATQESISMDVGGWHGQNGRHSPDAFASLSARSMR